VDDFIKQNPGYRKISPDISGFFERSNQALFSRRESNLPELIANLLAFSKRLRDCERGI
jgi:mxaA protein